MQSQWATDTYKYSARSLTLTVFGVVWPA